MHIIWHNGDTCGGLRHHLDPSLQQVIKKVMSRDEPVFLYHCGSRLSPLPEGFYWRMMSAHLSMCIYQLEIKDND